MSYLSKIGDPLEKLSVRIDFELFRPVLTEVFSNNNRTHNRGRPSWDYVQIFKILILQQWYNIADDQTEFMIKGRLTFQPLLGIR